MFDEYQNLTLFEETATTPTSLVALNIALWFGCQPDKAASCSDAVQAFLQSELEDTDFTNVIIPPELWLDHWHSRFSAYGRPKAGRWWQGHLDKRLCALGAREMPM